MKVYSAECPHMGGVVKVLDERLSCPLHGWKFSTDDGSAISVEGEKLIERRVQEIDGVLYVDLPEEPPNPPDYARGLTRADVDLELLAHACLRIDSAGFRLLTDPWLWGPAFMGAWHHYPHYPIPRAKTNVDAILITHEHSDHFHPPSLRRIRSSTPTFVPDFPNQRMPRRLWELGFTNVTAMRFGQRYQLADAVFVTTYEPTSWHNDSITLIESGGLRLLNLNDAGLNQRIAREIGPVDVVMSTFTPGASGYPLTWTHLSTDEKQQIMEESRVGSLEMLRHSMELYQAKMLLPFAGHFVLWQPDHEAYERSLIRNTVADVVSELGSDYAVLDLLPGESHDFSTGRTRRIWLDRTGMYDQDRVKDETRRLRSKRPPESTRPDDALLTRREVEDYFESLNAVPEIVFCEDMNVRINITDDSHSLTEFALEFTIRKHVMQGGKTPDAPVIEIWIPRRALSPIVRDGASWDEAHIGYWCLFHREPDQYHAAFWRLLQAPYFARPRLEKEPFSGAIGRNASVGQILESVEGSHRVFGRYGLYCLGCSMATSETVLEAGRKHGLSDATVDRMLIELVQLQP